MHRGIAGCAHHAAAASRDDMREHRNKTGKLCSRRLVTRRNERVIDDIDEEDCEFPWLFVHMLKAYPAWASLRGRQSSYYLRTAGPLRAPPSTLSQQEKLRYA